MHYSKRITGLALLVVALGAGAQEQEPPAKVPDSVRTQNGTVNIETLVRLDNPWGMAFLPDGRLLITEKPGRLRVYSSGKLSEPIGGVPKVDYFEQGGLLDVEIDPDFARNGFVYLSYSEAAEQQPKEIAEMGDARFGGFLTMTDNTLKGGAVARGKLAGNQLQNVQVIWRQYPKAIGRGHFGHRLVFAPDGKLFITSGDRMYFDPAQLLTSNLGKVVRINPDGSIPTDNPFVKTKNARSDVYSSGHRNMLGAAINPLSRALWINEMGPLGGDEINIIAAGKDYGWPTVSNGDNYDGSPIPEHSTQKKFEAPVRVWNPSISPSGFVFYSGGLFPSWRGNALIGGLSSKSLFRLTLDGNKISAEEKIDLGLRVRDVIEAPDGAVLLLVDGPNAPLLRLTPATR